MKGSRVYLHFLANPSGAFCWAECANRVVSAKWLATGEAVPFRQADGRLLFDRLPDPLPDPLVATLVLEVEGAPRALVEQSTFWIPG